MPTNNPISQLALDLRASFIWRDTPPGLDYWSQVFDNLSRLPDSRVEVPQPALSYYLESELLELFVWDDTPQGHDYWDAVYENLRKIGAKNALP